MNLEEIARNLDLSTLYDSVYRAKSTFDEHGLGPLQPYIASSDPWEINLDPKPSEHAVRADLTLMVSFSVLLAAEVFQSLTGSVPPQLTALVQSVAPSTA